ncbi:MAG: hypothetical protein APF81_17710 [Desulfosporosinus sp. BRH_c37]|nr:MAG: hypothetical protein APF81_17710 [Desulfosporosinus sp. BRH_c37]
MSIESFDEVKEYFEKNKEDETVKGYMKGFVSLDGVKSFLESDEAGKGYLQSYTDSKVSKGIESFKANSLSKLVDEEILKRSPSTDPMVLKLQAMQDEVDALKKEKERESLLNKGLSLANQKKIPADLIPYFLGETEESTISNLSSLEKSLQAYTQGLREQILAGGSHTPPAGGSNPTGLITQADWDKNKNDLDWYEKNKTKIFESKKQGLIK